MTTEPHGTERDPREDARLHDRWMALRHRRQESDTYRDEWWAEQCGAYRWWRPLSGPLGFDFGACTNESSAFDARVRFEHDGCEVFEASGGWALPDE